MSRPSDRFALAPASRRRLRGLVLSLLLLGICALGVSCASSADELLIQISQGDEETKGEAIVKLGNLLDPIFVPYDKAS